jgi:hypothetical protein
MHMTRQKSTHIALIIAICALVFANSLPGAFVWDDEIQIVKHWRIRSLDNLPRYFEEALKINPNYEDAGSHLAMASQASK